MWITCGFLNFSKNSVSILTMSIKNSDDTFGSFICSVCGEKNEVNDLIGTKNRNHCHKCLNSKHLDLDVSGDRASDCLGTMVPIALTFKQEGVDKYGKKKQGELMIVHLCAKCRKISINRLAGDDDDGEVLKLFSKTLILSDEQKESLKQENIEILEEKDKDEVYRQLFGNFIGK